MSFQTISSFLAFALVVSCHAPQACTVWPGWQSIKDLFVFGDSYTTTGFNDTLGPQPNSTNPLGNPPYPGYTSSDGPNWVDYLTTKYNESLVETYNLAYGGATVDASLVLAYLPTVLSLKQQVQDEFLPVYGNHPSFAPWTSEDSLFAFFIGINDVGNSYTQRNESELQETIFQEYFGLLEQVYSVGARNFLLLNVPPVQRSPLTASQGSAAQAEEAAAIEQWNGRVASLAHSFRHSHENVKTFLFDTYKLFNTVLDNPDSFPQTAQYKNTTDYCVAYENGTPTETYYNVTCGLPVNEYFWLNSLHPTYPMHDVLAQEVAETLEKAPKGGPGCDGDPNTEPGQYDDGDGKLRARRRAIDSSRIVRWKL